MKQEIYLESGDIFSLNKETDYISMVVDGLVVYIEKKVARDLAEEIFGELGLDRPEELREKIEELEEELEEWEASYNIRKRGII